MDALSVACLALMTGGWPAWAGDRVTGLEAALWR